MVLRRRRLCYAVVCICVLLDVTSSARNATSLNISAEHTRGWRNNGNERQLTVPPAAHLHTPKTMPRSAAAPPRCNPYSTHSSCLTSADPDVDLFLNAVTLRRKILDSSDQQPLDNFLTSAKIIQVENTAESSDNEQRRAEEDDESKPYTSKTSRLNLGQPSLHQSNARLQAVRRVRTNPVTNMMFRNFGDL